MLYPGENSKKCSQDCVSDAIRNGLAAWDIIDMSELMFGDVGCYVTYETGWIIVFYIALCLSAVLIAFSAFGLEKQFGRSTERSKECDGVDITITCLNLFFNDLLFLVLRLKTMLTQHSYYIESVFVVKEILSICARSALLMAYCCGDDQTKTPSLNGRKTRKNLREEDENKGLLSKESGL